jgi:hypothetical protein
MARCDRDGPPPPGGGGHRCDADRATWRAAHRKSQTAPLQGEGAARGRWTTHVLPEAQADSPRWSAAIVHCPVHCAFRSRGIRCQHCLGSAEADHSMEGHQKNEDTDLTERGKREREVLQLALNN